MRVVASDDYQGQVDAQYMKDDLGVTKVYILDDKELYGKGVADAFERLAKDIGLNVAGHEGWDKNAQNYKALMTKIKATRRRRHLHRRRRQPQRRPAGQGQGPDRRRQRRGQAARLRRLRALDSLFDEAGADNVTGTYGTAPTLNAGRADRAGQDVPRRLPAAEVRRAEVYTVYAAAAAQVLLDAIGRSDGSREDVLAKLFETEHPDAVVGPMSFNENGDPTARPRSRSTWRRQAATWKFKETKTLG